MDNLRAMPVFRQVSRYDFPQQSERARELRDFPRDLVGKTREHPGGFISVVSDRNTILLL